MAKAIPKRKKSRSLVVRSWEGEMRAKANLDPSIGHETEARETERDWRRGKAFYDKEEEEEGSSWNEKVQQSSPMGKENVTQHCLRVLST